MMSRKGHEGLISSVNFISKTEELVSAGHDKIVRVWNVVNGTQIQEYNGHDDIVYEALPSHNGRHVISRSPKMIHIWETKSGVCKNIISAYTYFFCRMAVTPDDQCVIIGTRDGSIIVLDTDSGRCLRSRKEHWLPINSIELSLDGRFLMSGGSDGVALIYDIERGKKLRTLGIRTMEGDGENVTAMALSPDGRIALVGYTASFTLTYWDLLSNSNYFKCRGHERQVNIVTFSCDNLRCASASDDRTIRIWDLRDLSCKIVLKDIPNITNTLKFTSDNQRLVGVDCKGNGCIWDIRNGKALERFRMPRYVSMSRIHPSNTFIYGTDSGELHSFSFKGSTNTPPLVIPTRIWKFGRLFEAGKWDQRITAKCPWCWTRFTVSEKITYYIDELLQEHGLLNDPNPYFRLPEEIGDNELFRSKCPDCKNSIRFTPFIVDNSINFP